ncbi:hypothetical protein F4703DRAFT_1972010 [Phycomyces blakesleeanus]
MRLFFCSVINGLSVGRDVEYALISKFDVTPTLTTLSERLKTYNNNVPTIPGKNINKTHVRSSLPVHHNPPYTTPRILNFRYFHNFPFLSQTTPHSSLSNSSIPTLCPISQHGLFLDDIRIALQ